MPTDEQIRAIIADLLAHEKEMAGYRGFSDCTCMSKSRKGEREYETGCCPHQRAKVLLSSAVPKQPQEDIRKRLTWVRTFIEYARYELQPGTQQPGDQFPRQDAADKAMVEIDAVLAALPGGDGQGTR